MPSHDQHDDQYETAGTISFCRIQFQKQGKLVIQRICSHQPLNSFHPHHQNNYI
ncbi:transcriptional regulator [Lactiplantibacillus plantarum]|nr:transcriptional regulator [Lactiplantibacillus plantarum]